MEQKALLTIDLDLAGLAQETANGKKQVAGLVVELKKLKEEGKENTAEYAQLEAQLKNNKDEVRQNALALANMTKAQKLNNGSIVEMRASLSAMTKQYNSLSKEERENLEIGVKLKNVIKAQSDELKELEKNTGNTSRNVGNYKESILEALEAQLPFVGSLRQSAASFNTMATNGGQAVGMLSKLKYALAATGIGLIVVAFGLLINYLRTLSPVMDKLSQIGAALGEVFKTLGGTLAGVTNIFTDFEGSMKKVGEFMLNPIKAIREYGNELGKAAKQAANLEKSQQDLDDAFSAQEVKTALAQSRIQQLMLQARNRTLSPAERQKFLKEASELDKKVFEDRRKLADDALQKAQDDIIARGKLVGKDVELLRQAGEAGYEYAQALEDRGKAEAGQVEALKAAVLARDEVERESTNRQEKLQNQADALAEKAAAAAEKREEKRKAAAEKAAAEREKALEKERALQAKRAELATQDGDILGGLNTDRSKQLLDKAQKEAIESLQAGFLQRKLELIRQGVETTELEKQHQRELQEIEYQYTLIRTTDSRKTELEQVRRKYEALIAEREKVGADTTAVIEAQRLAEIETNNKWDAVEKDNQFRRNEQDLIDQAEFIRRQNMQDDARLQHEEKVYGMRMDLANGFFNLMSDVFKKHTVLGKAAFIFQKTLAIAEIITNARRTMQVNTLAHAQAAAARTLLGDPTATAVEAIRAKIENGLTLASALVNVAAVASQTVQGFKTGGIFQSDGKGAKLKGRGTGTSDSINARLSNGESIINAKSTKMFAPLLSYINQLGGGRSFDKPVKTNTYATGGMFTDTLGVYNSNNVESAFNYAELASQMAKSVQPVLIMEEVEYKMQDREFIRTVQNQ